MKRLFAAIIVLFIVGCANTQITPEAKSAFQELKSEKIVVRYTLTTKKIQYSETLYRGFWAKTNTATRDISGVWQPDRDLSEYLASSITKHGYKAVSVYDIIPEELVGNIEQSNKKGVTPLQDSLNKMGYKYLFELTAMNLNGAAEIGGLIWIGASPKARLIDLDNSRVVWTDQFQHYERYQFGGNLRALEVDGMRKAKEGIRFGIDKIDFATIWSVNN
jgi:hypothetical protein